MSFLQLKVVLTVLFAASQMAGAASAGSDTSSSSAYLLQTPPTLSFDDLEKLASIDPIPARLKEKLDGLLTKPFISNEAKGRGAVPKAPHVPELGPVLRIAEWNINRGENESEVELALTDSSRFLAAARNNPSMMESDLRRAADELNELNGADVVVLDEVDDGVKRTKYRNVARDLAKALNMNYVYGVEFIELDRIYLGMEKMDQADKFSHAAGEVFHLEPSRYLGLEGSAILSRYPIHDARIVRLPQRYDWYHQEIKAISDVEKARRWTSEQLFEERITRQVRRGGRMAMVVDLEVPQSPTGLVTVVCPHLEDYTTPAGRLEQLDFLLGEIQDISNPVVLTGDFNTTGRSARPITVRREILKYLKDYRFWIRQVLFLVAPVPGLGYVFHAVNYFKNYHDPSAFNVPILLGNRSKKLFDHVENFQFKDGGTFDFAGNKKASYRRHGKTLASSNQRAWKGFTPTFAFKRTFKGLVGRYKIDWFFIKRPEAKQSSREDENASFTPHLGRTLQLVNDGLEPRISDHCPITVTLPLGTADRPLRKDSATQP
ncbi:MAG: endonuclease/exonuclease/phosphatase family protein [Bryobacteraceae bacterium]